VKIHYIKNRNNTQYLLPPIAINNLGDVNTTELYRRSTNYLKEIPY